eukprot:1767-Heterococcus_DN1.PRE.4
MRVPALLTASLHDSTAACIHNTTTISTTNSKRVPTALTWLMVLCTYGQSMLVFMIYGFKGEIYQQWYRAVQIRSFRRVTRRAGSVRHTVKGPEVINLKYAHIARATGLLHSHKSRCTHSECTQCKVVPSQLAPQLAAVSLPLFTD